MNTSSNSQTLAAPRQLPTWSIGNATGTLFCGGNPTGTQLTVFNRDGGDPADLVAQANLVAEMQRALTEISDRARAMMSAGGEVWRDVHRGGIPGGLQQIAACAERMLKRAEALGR